MKMNASSAEADCYGSISRMSVTLQVVLFICLLFVYRLLYIFNKFVRAKAAFLLCVLNFTHMLDFLSIPSISWMDRWLDGRRAH